MFNMNTFPFVFKWNAVIEEMESIFWKKCIHKYFILKTIKDILIFPIQYEGMIMTATECFIFSISRLFIF